MKDCHVSWGDAASVRRVWLSRYRSMRKVPRHLVVLVASVCLVGSAARAQDRSDSQADRDRDGVRAAIAPAYPRMAWAAGITGAVTVDVTVGPDGRVDMATVRSGHPLLRDA